MHWVWTRGVDVPENISWAGNYYGFPHMMCVQFLRTGKVEYFDAFEAHALHAADVHTVHYAGDRPQLTVASGPASKDRIADELFLHELAQFGGTYVLHIHSQHHCIARLVIVVKNLQLRHLFQTGRTPGSPVIDQNPFSPVIGELVVLAFQVAQSEVDLGSRQALSKQQDKNAKLPAQFAYHLSFHPRFFDFAQ